jgi:hypothetical protein
MQFNPTLSRYFGLAHFDHLNRRTVGICYGRLPKKNKCDLPRSPKTQASKGDRQAVKWEPSA